MKHLFVDISAHGLGHLAQTAPILNALLDRRPLRLTVRSGLTEAQLARRIRHPFAHIHAASDFGFVMHDALRVDRAASAECYRTAFADWLQRVAREAALLQTLAPDLVLSNISPLPLAGAQAAQIPALAMCSLNWADLFEHYFGTQAWAAPIHAALLAAYAGARGFLRLTPGMPMSALDNLIEIGPVSTYATGNAPGTCNRSDRSDHLDRAAVARALDLPQHKRWLLIALGGIAHRLPVESWPMLPDIQVLVPAEWQVGPRADMTSYAEAQLPFAELLPNVDALLGKPGYGTFVEAACCGVPVLYLRRPDWPEAECLEHWLQAHARCAEITPPQAERGELVAALAALLRQPSPPPPLAEGLPAALRCINAALDGNDTIAP